MSYYLIDFENVKSRGMEGVELLTEEDTVCIFYSDNADCMTFDLHQMLNETKAKIIYHKVAVGTKNALDFQLATYLGYLICEQQKEDIHPNYFIVTKDNGFTSLMVYWKAQGVPVRIIRNLLWGKNQTIEQNLSVEESAGNVEETVEETAIPVDVTVQSMEELLPVTTESNDTEEKKSGNTEKQDEAAEPVKKPTQKSSNTRKKSTSKTTEKKAAEKKATDKKTTDKKATDKPDELSQAVSKVLADQTIVPQVVKFIRQYKTKQGINNALNKEFKDSKRTSEIYSAIKPLIADKKGK